MAEGSLLAALLAAGGLEILHFVRESGQYIIMPTPWHITFCFVKLTAEEQMPMNLGNWG